MSDEWYTVPLETLVETRISYGVVQPGSYDPSGIPIIRVKDIRRGTVDTDNPFKIACGVEEKHSRTRLSGGEVLLTLVGSVGEVAIVPDKCRNWNVARAIAVIRVKSNISPQWVKACIEHGAAQQFIKERLNTTVQATLNLADVRALPVPMPSRGIRNGIQQMLGALDDKIAVNERIATTARELGSSLFQQAVQCDKIEISLESITAHISRGVAPKYTEDVSGMTVLNQKCIRNGFVNLESSRRTIAEKVKELKQLRRNDVLVNSTGVGTLGRVARWTGSETVTVDSHVSIVRFDNGKVDPVCAGFALLLAEPQIKMLGEGSTGQTELKRAQLAAFEIVLPAADRQPKLRETLELLEDRVDQARVESNTLAELRDTLLPRLMSGEIRVKDAEKAVEDVT